MMKRMNKMQRITVRQKINTTFLLLASFIYPVVLQAQNSTQSPNTRYGYGRLADRDVGYQRGMGGIGIGMRNPLTINPLNPAAASSIDSMTFILDVGIMGEKGWYKDGSNNKSAGKKYGNFEYLAMQFPLSKKMAMNLGFEPVSSVGYSYGDTEYLPTVDQYSQYASFGSKGFNKIYGVISYKFSSNFSAGINLGYLFGDIIHQNQTSNNIGYTVQNVDTLRSSALLYEAGIQYVYPVSKTKNWVLGIVFSPKIKLNTTYYYSNIQFENSGGTIQNIKSYSSQDSIFELPETYGLGITYNIKNKLSVGADALYQRWASAKFYDKTNSLSDRLKINAGIEFTPDARNTNLLKRIHYRAGAYYANSYIKIKGYGYDEYGAGLGLGIPVSDRRSMLNLAFNYANIVPKAQSLMHEKYFKITVSYTFNELWFFKRKVQ